MIVAKNLCRSDVPDVTAERAIQGNEYLVGILSLPDHRLRALWADIVIERQQIEQRNMNR